MGGFWGYGTLGCMLCFIIFGGYASILEHQQGVEIIKNIQRKPACGGGTGHDFPTSGAMDSPSFSFCYASVLPPPHTIRHLTLWHLLPPGPSVKTRIRLAGIGFYGLSRWESCHCPYCPSAGNHKCWWDCRPSR